MARSPKSDTVTRDVARTSAQADTRGHQKVEGFDLEQHLTALQHKMGTRFSSENANPGDIAWTGPCENGTRVVCYYDAAMQPTDCRNQTC